MNPLHFGQVNPVVWAVSIVFLFVLFRLLGPDRSGLFPGYRQGPDSFIIRLNYILKCFLLIDLKTTQISHQDVGQMDMYVRMYDELKRTDGDNPTIGLILCTETSRDIARYSVLHENPQLFAAKYLTYLPKEEELREEIERQKEIYSLQQIEEK